jgi:RimJ/RimL family protein N-acetyltransferase
LEFRALKFENMENVRRWRAEIPAVLRTSRELTKEQQENFYKNVVCDRNANSYYWAVYDSLSFVGQAGIENIEWCNRRGEISLVLDPDQRGRGLGTQAFDLLLNKGFGELNLDNIYGECYTCNPYLDFWYKMIEKYKGYFVKLEHTKFWNGSYYDSLWFNFSLTGTQLLNIKRN